MIAVHVRNDVELFRSVAEFKEGVTSSALRDFDHVEIVAGGRGLTIWTTFVRWNVPERPRPRSCPWLTRGVLVQVEPRSDDLRPSAVTARDKVAAAIERGIDDTSVPRDRGATWQGSEAESEAKAVLDQRARPSREARLLLAALAALLPLWLVDGELHVAWFVAIVTAGLLVGWFVLARLWTGIAYQVWPQVAIREHALSFRFARWITVLAALLFATFVLNRIFGFK